MAKRKAMSKKIRFEIFKRDKFSCKYCGKSPANGSILNVDHVIPVAHGGTNDFENLVTSCFDCNNGKSDNFIDVSSVSNHEYVSKEKFEEYKEQVKSFFAFVDAKEKTTEKIVNAILSELGNSETDFDKNHKQSIRVFMKEINYNDLLDYAAQSNAKLFNKSIYTKFKYFCGICHKVIKNKNGVNDGKN